MVTTAVEKIDDTKIKLSITVEADRVTAAIDEAARRLAGSMKIPGFRPGKAPLRVIESRLGTGAVQEEAVRSSVPGFYSEALREVDVQPVSQPKFEVGEFSRGKEGTFDALVDVRPEFDVPEYEGMVVEHPEWELTEEELDQNLDAMRERFAEVETVERPARAGDYVVVTVTGKDAEGNEVEDASGEDILYQIPEEETDSELDKVLPGSEAGAIHTFTDTLGPDYPEELAGRELEFTAIVKEVKEKVMPELDDEFALTASEFDTIDELKADLREQAGAEKLRLALANLRGKVIEEIAEKVDIALPESMIEEEQRFRLNRIAHQAEHNGIPFQQFLAMVSGGDPQALLDQLEEEARQTVKAQLVVDEIGQAIEVKVEQDDLGQEIARQAARLGRDPNELAQMMLQPDRIGALYADAYRRKTIDHVMSVVEITGAPPEDVVAKLNAPQVEDAELEDAEVEDAAASDEEE